MLLEGSLGVRLRAEYGFEYDRDVDMAGFVYDKAARDALGELWRGYMGVARKHSLPFIATTPTRRANRERVDRSRFGDGIIADNVLFLREIMAGQGGESYVGASFGCRGDAYRGTGALSEKDARKFHRWALERAAAGGVDVVYAMLMPTLPETLGFVQACADAALSVVVSFTIRRDGRLVDGTLLRDAIERIDAKGIARPLCYMANCVHPETLVAALSVEANRGGTVAERFLGFQPNASPLAPDALDGSRELHGSEPRELARALTRLEGLVRLKILGGCCGTNEKHLDAMAEVLLARGYGADS